MNFINVGGMVCYLRSLYNVKKIDNDSRLSWYRIKTWKRLKDNEKLIITDVGDLSGNERLVDIFCADGWGIERSYNNWLTIL